MLIDNTDISHIHVHVNLWLDVLSKLNLNLKIILKMKYLALWSAYLQTLV